MDENVKAGLYTGLGGVAVYIFKPLWNKLTKKDCSDCEPVMNVNAELVTMRRILLKIAHKVGIDDEEVEGLIR